MARDDSDPIDYLGSTFFSLSSESAYASCSRHRGFGHERVKTQNPTLRGA